MKEDVATILSWTQRISRGPLYQHAPSQSHHYHPMQGTQYSMVPPQYALYNPHSYPHLTNYPQWRRQHIKMLAPLLRILKHPTVSIQDMNLGEIRGLRIISQQLESLTQVYLRN